MRWHHVFVLVLCLSPFGLAHAQDTRSASAVDGDTILLADRTLDLRGIDAPEVGQNCKNADGSFYACGQQATAYLSDFLKGRSVSCVAAQDIREGYRCFADGADVSERVVSQGFAVADRFFGSDYGDAEALAKRDRRGIWQGDFVMPAEWRQRIATNPPVIVGHR